uniref:GDP-Man:Man(3)GlcNAc(2)-PP-Dol alpha-1,2-mannosyltransferase n=1 Tax=Schistocephalus solidus TaxID=70667 RepID=A0A0X3NR10_SCHSO
MAFLFILFVLTTIIAISLTLFLMGKRILIRRKLSDEHRIHKNCVILAFFHPYCNSGGGGERVLWTGISAILQRWPNVFIFIYTNDKECLTAPVAVFRRVNSVFGIDILKLKALSRIQFVPLITEPLLRPSQYPHFTLAGQALGSVIAALEAVFRRPPDIFLDTTGFSFTMPIFAWLAGSACGAYVHFPTISSDMEIRVREQGLSGRVSEGTAYNNSEEIRRNKFLTAAKLAYYYIFKKAYCWSGSKPNCELAAVNSSWTKNHISRMWGGSPVLLYPPCPVEHLIDKKTSAEGRKPWIISVGQFRPEKNHRLQILAFARFIKTLSPIRTPPGCPYRLLLVGGSRDGADAVRVEKLRELVEQLGLSDLVDFHINASWDTLGKLFKHSSINLHSMVDEHFGIGIVEGMAAGLVTIAHRSGGPLTDIIGPAQGSLPTAAGEALPTKSTVGFLASTETEYARLFEYVLVQMTPAQRQMIGEAAAARANTMFSEAAFIRGWMGFLKCL